MSGGWNTIESDAVNITGKSTYLCFRTDGRQGVFTYLVDSLGVKNVQFEELIALDADYLKEQRPVYGVIFLFKYPTGEGLAIPKDGSFDFEAGESLFFAAQTIQNACGTQAVLSVLLNQEKEVDIGPKLREFKEFTGAFPSNVPYKPHAPERQVEVLIPDEQLRGEALSNSELIRDVHNSFARSSPFIDEMQPRGTEEADVYHFIAYTSISGVLYELDGLQPAPISHGACTFEEFPVKVIPVLQRRIERYPSQEIRFNLMAMVRDLRLNARDIGDQEWLNREEQKRTTWQWETALRRHNFVGFTSEILKGVVRTKLLDDGDDDGKAYNEWVEVAKASTLARAKQKHEAQEVHEEPVKKA